MIDNELVEIIKFALPMIIVCLGWLVTGRINYLNFRKQKLLEVNMKAFDDYKKSYMDMMIQCGLFIGKIGIIIELLSKEESMKKIVKVDETFNEEFINEYNNSQEKLGEGIEALHRTLTMYDNLFVNYNKERLALNLLVSDIVSKNCIIPIKLQVLISKKVQVSNEEKLSVKEDCIVSLREYCSDLSYMLKVYEEFNIMIQNELFKDITKNISKVIRKKDDNINYVENLLDKYSVVLDSYEIR